jgi:hypothetical protein
VVTREQKGGLGFLSLKDQFNEHDQNEEGKGPLYPDASQFNRVVDPDERSNAATTENGNGQGIVDCAFVSKDRGGCTRHAEGAYFQCRSALQEGLREPQDQDIGKKRSGHRTIEPSVYSHHKGQESPDEIIILS